MNNYLSIALFAIMMFGTAIGATAQTAIKLPAPDKNGGMPLMEALSKRSSAREYAAGKELTSQQLSNLLWAANGANRADKSKRTAPAAMNWHDTEIYVVMRSGIYYFSPEDHSLTLSVEGNYMKETGQQDFVDKAALNLVYVSNSTKLSKVNEDERPLMAGIHVGAIVQNVYLYCASEGLNSVVRLSIDTEKLSGIMGLSKDKKIILAQTVGLKP
jgi:SagB-type dehydrogenase family enzyme